MYQNSYGHIKLEGHLSKRFNIRKGTEQGHPLSPDLFKHFLSDLSPRLGLGNCPELAGMKISHLLWADDLILLSLDKATAQRQLNVLNKYCKNWGLEVNTSKTKAMIISESDCDSETTRFTLGNIHLQNVDEYCYLGITLHKSGSLKTAMDILKTKATRAFFGLKRTVIRSSVSFTAMRTLFDSLIKPVILYGSPIWLPTLSVIKQIVKEVKYTNSLSNPSYSQNFTKKISNLPFEKIHLSFLRWALGVHRKSSTIGMWGDTGRYPLIYQAIKLTLDYYKRVENLKTSSIVSAALREQKQMNLPWYKTIKGLLEIDKIYHQDHVSAYRTLYPLKSKSFLPPEACRPTSNSCLGQRLIPEKSEKFRPLHIVKQCKEHFVGCWKQTMNTSPKLNLFYAKIKNKFEEEPYLKHMNNAANKYRTTRLRISAHDLEIETGRYKNISRSERCCNWCNIKTGESVVEDESHVLLQCELYNKPRKKLLTTLKNMAQKMCPNFPSDQSKPDVIDKLMFEYSSLTMSSLKSRFFIIHSPYSGQTSDLDLTTSENYDSNVTMETLTWHHLKNRDIQDDITRINPTKSTSETGKLETIHNRLNTYVHNAIGAFIGSCFETRWEFLSDLKNTPQDHQLLSKGKPAKPKRAASSGSNS